MIHFLKLIVFLGQIFEEYNGLESSERKFNFANIIVLVVFIVKSILLQRTLDRLAEVVRLKLLRQLWEHTVLYCDLKSVVFKFGNFCCESHFKADFHDVSLRSESFRVPVLLFKACIVLAFVFKLDCALVSVFKLLFNS